MDRFALHSREHIGSNVKNGMDWIEEESEQVRDDFSSQGKSDIFEDCGIWYGREVDPLENIQEEEATRFE